MEMYLTRERYIDPQERPAGTRGKPPAEPAPQPAPEPETTAESPATEADKDGE
jgi:hypothetical protein